MKNLIKSFRRHSPNVQWAIDLLAIYAPDDPIFAKSYKYVRPKKDYDIFLDNEDDFYDDLPRLNEKTIRKTNRIQMPKKVRREKDLQRIRDIQARLNERESDLIDKLAQPDSDSYDSEIDQEDEELEDENDQLFYGESNTT